MRFFSDTWYLFLRHMRTTLRMPVWVILSIIQPILWLVIFGQLFRAVATLRGFENASYQQFLAPGLVILSAFMSSSYSGMGMLHDLQQGVLDRLLATPVSRSALIVSRVLQASVMSMVQGVVVLAVAWLFAVRPPGGLRGVVAVLLAAAFLGAACSAASNGLSLVIRQAQILVATINFLLLPALFLSSMMMSPQLMPGWIRGVAAVNPLDWGVQVARTGFEGKPWASVGIQAVLLAALVAVSWMAALKAFDRYRRAL